MSEVYVFLADGFEEIEGLTVVDVLRRAGVKVKTVSVTGKKTVCGSHDIEVEADRKFEKTTFEKGKMLVLPGGMPGTVHLREHEGLCSLLKEWDAAGRQIAAICAAPTVLAGLGILDGKKATVYPGMQDGLANAVYMERKVVTDGNITTGRGMGAAIAFSLRLVEILRGASAAQILAEKIVYEEWEKDEASL